MNAGFRFPLNELSLTLDNQKKKQKKRFLFKVKQRPNKGMSLSETHAKPTFAHLICLDILIEEHFDLMQV